MCVLRQQTSSKRWFGNRTMTSICDATIRAHQIQITTLCHWMKPPMKIFCVRHLSEHVDSGFQTIKALFPSVKYNILYTTTEIRRDKFKQKLIIYNSKQVCVLSSTRRHHDFYPAWFLVVRKESQMRCCQLRVVRDSPVACRRWCGSTEFICFILCSFTIEPLFIYNRKSKCFRKYIFACRKGHSYPLLLYFIKFGGVSVVREVCTWSEIWGCCKRKYKNLWTDETQNTF